MAGGEVVDIKGELFRTFPPRGSIFCKPHPASVPSPKCSPPSPSWKGSCLTLACSFLTRVACLCWASWELFSFRQEAAWFSAICCCSASTCSSSTSCSDRGFILFNPGPPVSMGAPDSKSTGPYAARGCSLPAGSLIIAVSLGPPLELGTKAHSGVERTPWMTQIYSANTH